jgi:retinol dehydrogenase-13
MKGKIIIVTGASAGIGKETAFQLLEDGADVIYACRDYKKTMRVLDEIEKKDKKLVKRAHFIELNLSSFKSVENFVNEFKKKFSKLDILINNAAAFPLDFELTEDKIESNLQMNYVSLVIMTLLLLNKFDKNEGRILNLTSFAHIQCDYSVDYLEKLQKDHEYKSIERAYYGNLWLKHYHYANTKTAVIFFTTYLKEFLEKNHPHIKVASVNPGLVYTEFARFVYSSKIFGKVYDTLWFTYQYLAKSALSGAQSSLHVCYLDYNEVVSGAYYSDCKLSQSSKLTKSKEIREKVIEYTAHLIGKSDVFKNNDIINMLKHY